MTDIVKRIYLGTDMIWEYSLRTRQLIDYTQSMGYDLPSKKTMDVIDDFMIATDWTVEVMDLLYIFFGDGSPLFKSINVMNPGYCNGTSFGGLVWDLSGVRGNAIDGYMNTNFNPALLASGQKYQLNNASRGFTLFSEPVASQNANRFIDLTESGGNSFCNADTGFNRINSGTASTSSIDTRGLGVKVIHRENDSDLKITVRDTVFERASPAVGLGNENQLILGRSNGSYTNGGISNYFNGASLTFDQTQEFRSVSNYAFAKLGLAQVA